MNWTLARAVRCAATSAALAVALVGPVASAAGAAANATPHRAGMPATSVPLQSPDPDGVPTNPNDPRCAAMPYVAQCQGGPYSHPTGPADSECLTQPFDPVCAGGPYAPLTPSPPPAVPSPPPMAPIAPPPTADGIGTPGSI